MKKLVIERVGDTYQVQVRDGRVRVVHEDLTLLDLPNILIDETMVEVSEITFRRAE